MAIKNRKDNLARSLAELKEGIKPPERMLKTVLGVIPPAGGVTNSPPVRLLSQEKNLPPFSGNWKSFVLALAVIVLVLLTPISKQDTGENIFDLFVLEAEAEEVELDLSDSSLAIETESDLAGLEISNEESI